MTNNIVFEVSFRNTSIDNSNIEAFSSEVFPSPLDESKSNAFSIFTPKFHFESTNPRWIGKRLYELPSSQYSIG